MNGSVLNSAAGVRTVFVIETGDRQRIALASRRFAGGAFGRD